MKPSIRTLEPNALWNNFADLNEVPRGSKKEARVIVFMKKFGESLGLDTMVDDIGNVVIKKPATIGMENRRTVVLQSHIDMVHQKNADTDFDFDNEGIRSYIDDDWVKAEGTTLGADNGIGVASIMTILASKDIPHPAIEGLFTIDEEQGMTGAQNMGENLIEGKILLNLDTEDDDELCIGCAGGVDTNTLMTYKQRAIKPNSVAYKISFTGLKGGHSGMEIHLGRGNSNKLMTRLLYKMRKSFGMRLVDFDGGSLRNAIPREAFATVVVRKTKKADFIEEFNERVADISREYKSVEPDLKIVIEKVELPTLRMSRKVQEKILTALHAAHNGVFRWSPDIPDLVETSSSLARVIIKDGTFVTQSMQRSSIESGKWDVAHTVGSAFESIGANVEYKGSYPGWAPNTNSPILKTMEDLYKSMFDEKPSVAACHAGLECGIILDQYPGLDTISFGPTIRHPHSPDEKVNIPSVQKYWKFLLATLESIPEKE
ncbi:MAG: aminoacyl-histidine dipeptidase [Bacteroidetes bacterium]|nr:aminoacyl-histidine dipeptidase [Bacteroidota bacterium]